jgi:hypothetical protein
MFLTTQKMGENMPANQVIISFENQHSKTTSAKQFYLPEHLALFKNNGREFISFFIRFCFFRTSRWYIPRRRRAG